MDSICHWIIISCSLTVIGALELVLKFDYINPVTRSELFIRFSANDIPPARAVSLTYQVSEQKSAAFEHFNTIPLRLEFALINNEWQVREHIAKRDQYMVFRVLVNFKNGSDVQADNQEIFLVDTAGGSSTFTKTIRLSTLDKSCEPSKTSAAATDGRELVLAVTLPIIVALTIALTTLVVLYIRLRKEHAKSKESMERTVQELKASMVMQYSGSNQRTNRPSQKAVLAEPRNLRESVYEELPEDGIYSDAYSYANRDGYVGPD